MGTSPSTNYIIIFINILTTTHLLCASGRRGAVGKCVSQHLSGAVSSPAGSVSRDLNLQKLNYQYLTTSVAVVLVVR